MLNRSRHPRVAIAACVVAGALHAGTARADEDASAWDGDGRSAVRLIAASTAPSARVRAGVQITLKSGWHTYWRYPGEAGVPPRFDFTGSRNVQSARVLWPAPQRISEHGLTAIGYTKDVLLPLSVVPQTEKDPLILSLAVDYAICERLCVPAQGRVQLDLTHASASYNGMLAGAQLRVPKKRELGEGSSLAIRSVRRDPHWPLPRVLVQIAAPAGTDADLFVEGPTPAWAFPVPTPLDANTKDLRSFAFNLEGAPPGAQYAGAVVTMTAVTADDAIEVNVPLD
jgi:DsbC/DsbD-like thiol-disulfide interchange protein